MKLIAAGIVSIAALFTSVPAFAEPGEGGMTEEEACDNALEHYAGRGVGVPACEIEWYELIEKELKCSPEIKRQADMVHERCGRRVAPKSQGPTKCTMPPPGVPKRYGPTRFCLTMVNPNSDAKCVFYFTYLHSTKGRLAGGNVEPGKTDERCTAEPGVVLQFDKWTLVGGSAR